MKSLQAFLATHAFLAALCSAGELTFDEPTPFADAIEDYAKANSDANRTINIARLVLSQPPLIRDSLISNDFHFTYDRLVRDEKKTAGWSGWQWLASALDDEETLCITNEYGAIQTLTTNGKLFRFSNESARFEMKSAKDEWVFSLATLNSNPVFIKSIVSNARWAEISKGRTRFRIDLGALLRETWVMAITASTDPPVVVYRTAGNVNFEMRLHNPVDLIRFQTPLRSLRMVSLDGNGIGRLMLRRGSSVPPRKTIAERILHEWTAPTDDNGVLLPLIKFSDDLQYAKRSTKRPAASDVWTTIQKFAVESGGNHSQHDGIIQDDEELSHLLYFMASMASEILGDIHFNEFTIGSPQNVSSTFVRNIGPLAKLAKRTAAKAQLEVPCDEPAAGHVFSTYCTPLSLTMIERYACRLIEGGELSEPDRFALIEGIADWGEPSFYDAECLLPETLSSSLTGGIIKTRWGKLVSDDEIAALVSAAVGAGQSRLPAVESLIAGGHMELIPKNSFNDWYDERVIKASQADRALAIHRLTSTKMGRSYYQQHAKSLSADRDLQKLVDDVLDTRRQATRVELQLLSGADINSPKRDWKSLSKRLLR